MPKITRRSFNGTGIDRSASFKILLSSLVNSVEDDEEENAMLSKAERRERRKKQVRSLDSAPKPNDSRFVDKPSYKPTNDGKRVSFDGKNNAVAVSPAPTARTAPNTLREVTNHGGEISHFSSNNKKASSFSLLKIASSSGTIFTGPYSRNAIKGLNLQQRELRILKHSFDSIDEDKNGIIDKLELLHALGEKGEISNLFVDKLFDMVDFDGDEGINFDEFIHMSGMYVLRSILHISSFTSDA